MKRLIFIIILIITFIISIFCTSNNTPYHNTNNNLIQNSIDNNSDYIISKETMIVKDINPNDNKGQIEYIISKEYLYTEDWKIIDTVFTSNGFIYYYDDKGNVIEKRPLTEKEDQAEKYNSKYYIENMNEIVKNLKDTENHIVNKGQVKLDSKGRIIEEVIDNNGSETVIKYEYDEKGRIIRKYTIYSEYEYSDAKFTYDENDRVIKITWSFGEFGYSERYYTYKNNLLVEIFEMYRNDIEEGVDYTIKFEYTKKD
ncbi:MAG: hypothetical protein ACOCV8_05225 [Spirochaetota bacterium]